MATAQLRRVIQESHRLVGAGPAQVAYYRLAGLSGTQDQHAQDGLVGSGLLVVLPRAIQQSWHPEQRREHYGIKHEYGARDLVQPVVQLSLIHISEPTR